MKKIILGLFGVLSLVLLVESIFSSNNQLIPPPYDKINISTVVELEPKIMDYEEYSKQDYEDQKKYTGMWSTLNQINLDSIKINASASSTLKGYHVTNLKDNKLDTAWVEGVSGDGINEWVSIKLDAKRDSPDATFTIGEFCVIPGYTKSQKTWEENNRIKKALLIIYSPKAIAPEYEYVACRLNFEDTMKLQAFNLFDSSVDLVIPNFPMTKTVWFVIEDVYKGTKYSDTCISEIVIQGGCLP